MTPLTAPALELLTWNVTRYQATAPAEGLGDRRLELLEGIISIVPNPDQFHEWLIRQVIQILVSALGDTALVDKGQPVKLSALSLCQALLH
jgi:hypothetical protein